jgi:uncharacterized protein (TIGR02246 family)
MQHYWQRTHALCVGLVLSVVAVGGFLTLRTGRASHEPPAQPAGDPRRTEDEQAIKKNRTAYVKAFNAGDARAAAALWSAEGELTDPDGRVVRGSAAIEKDLAALFKEHGPLTIAITCSGLHFVTPELALETGTSQVTRPSDGEVSSARYEVVHVKQDGTWRLASVKESEAPSVSNPEHLKDLDWLVGAWSAKGGDVELQMSCEWSEDKNYLVRKYKVKIGAAAAHSGTQMIGWDPSAGGIVSAVCDSNGMGSELWSRDGDHWMIEAAGVTKDGRETQSTNLVKRVSADCFTWRSVERSIDGVALPDTPEIRVTRVKSDK